MIRPQMSLKFRLHQRSAVIPGWMVSNFSASSAQTFFCAIWPSELVTNFDSSYLQPSQPLEPLYSSWSVHMMVLLCDLAVTYVQPVGIRS
jgi:hypothetical protein